MVIETRRLLALKLVPFAVITVLAAVGLLLVTCVVSTSNVDSKSRPPSGKPFSDVVPPHACALRALHSNTS
jgi:hypothetical protein